MKKLLVSVVNVVVITGMALCFGTACEEEPAQQVQPEPKAQQAQQVQTEPKAEQAQQVQTEPKAEPERQAVWLTDLKEAQQLAEKEKKVILADFSGSDWCGWCIKLDREVFSQAAFKQYAADNLVLVLIDFPRKKWQTPAQKQTNRELAQKYGIQGFPTVLLLNPDGSVIVRTGYRRGGAEAYVTYLKEQLKR